MLHNLYDHKHHKHMYDSCVAKIPNSSMSSKTEAVWEESLSEMLKSLTAHGNYAIRQ